MKLESNIKTFGMYCIRPLRKSTCEFLCLPGNASSRCPECLRMHGEAGDTPGRGNVRIDRTRTAFRPFLSRPRRTQWRGAAGDRSRPGRPTPPCSRPPPSGEGESRHNGIRASPAVADLAVAAAGPAGAVVTASKPKGKARQDYCFFRGPAPSSALTALRRCDRRPR